MTERVGSAFYYVRFLRVLRLRSLAARSFSGCGHRDPRIRLDLLTTNRMSRTLDDVFDLSATDLRT